MSAGRPLPPAIPLTFCSSELLFWRGAGSGCTLFPSPHDVVAVIGDENAGRATANPQTEWSSVCQSIAVSHKLFPLKKAFLKK
jgi:hypothetical protein